jgi:hypothetical protein
MNYRGPSAYCGQRTLNEVWLMAGIILALIPNEMNQSGSDHTHPKYLERYKEIHVDK